MKTKLRVATTGLSGLVGTRLQQVLDEDATLFPLSGAPLDIADRAAVDAAFEHLEADFLLHLAAFTNVDACEADKETARQINIEGTRHVFEAAQKKAIRFIYMSTGFVFDGENPPYYEDSTPHPISYYGETKYEGEKLVEDNAMILRIDYPYGSKVEHKKDMVESLIGALRDKKPLSGIVDQLFTPTYIDDIAHTLLGLMNNFLPEIFHVVGADSLSGFDIIKTIGDVFDLDTSHVEKITYEEFYKNKARRPKMNVMKTRHQSFPMKTFRAGLQDLKTRLENA